MPQCRKYAYVRSNSDRPERSFGYDLFRVLRPLFDVDGERMGKLIYVGWARTLGDVARLKRMEEEALEKPQKKGNDNDRS